MALDLADKTKLALMRNVLDAPKVADLIESMDKSYGDLPAMKQVNSTFGDLASKNQSQLKKLNDVLEKNPGLADKIKANLGQNPEAFRTQFLPAIFKNPENAVALAAQAPGVKPVAPAPIQKSYDYPEPGPVRTAAANKKAIDVALSAATEPLPLLSKGADARIDAKMAELGKAEGYDDLMERVAHNPNLSAAMKAVLATSGGPADREKSIDTLLQKTKDDPKFFRNIVQKIDTFPGSVDGIAAEIASHPDKAINKLSKLGEDGGLAGMAGAGGMASLAKMFSGANIMEMIMSVISAVMGRFGASSKHFVIGNNNLLEQYGETLKATNAKPDQVAVLDSGGQVVSGAQAQAQAQTATEQNKTKLAAPQQN